MIFYNIVQDLSINKKKYNKRNVLYERTAAKKASWGGHYFLRDVCKQRRHGQPFALPNFRMVVSLAPKSPFVRLNCTAAKKSKRFAPLAL